MDLMNEAWAFTEPVVRRGERSVWGASSVEGGYHSGASGVANDMLLLFRQHARGNQLCLQRRRPHRPLIRRLLLG